MKYMHLLCYRFLGSSGNVAEPGLKWIGFAGLNFKNMSILYLQQTCNITQQFRVKEE